MYLREDRMQNYFYKQQFGMFIIKEADKWGCYWSNVCRSNGRYLKMGNIIICACVGGNGTLQRSDAEQNSTWMDEVLKQGRGNGIQCTN